MQDRRSNPRLSAFFPISFSTPERSDRIAMSKDASEKGLLFGTPSNLRVGDEVSLSFRILPDSDLTDLTARVVRAERVPSPVHALWRYLVAVELDQPLALEEVSALRSASNKPQYKLPPTVQA